MTLQAQDLFADTNGTVIASHTPDFDREAGGWTDHKDAASIQSNQYQYTDGANNFSLSTIDLGTSEQLIRLNGQIPDTSGTLEDVSIVLRFVDASNYWIVRATGDGQAEIVKVLAGVFTVEASATVSAYVPGANVTIEGRARNDIIQFIDSANNIAITITATDHNSATEAGVTLQSSVGGAGGGFIDNFKTYDMTPIGTLPMASRIFIPSMMSFPTIANTIKSSGTAWDVSGVQVVHLLCNDNLPTDVIVNSGTGSNATLVGGDNTDIISQANGKINRSLKPNGTDDYFDADNNIAALSATKTGGISFWVNPADITVDVQTFVSFGDTDGDSLIQLDIPTTNGVFRAFQRASGLVSWNFETDNAAFTNGVFTHVVFNQDGVSPVVFIGGVLITDVTFSTSTDTKLWFNDIPGLSNIRIAARSFNNAGPDKFTNAEFDDIRILSRPFSLLEIAAIHNNGLGTEASSGIF